MKNHRILNPAEHGQLRVRTEAGASFGDAAMACLTVPPEFRRLCTEYPIVFRHDVETGHYSALALLGFEAGENLFLEGDRWDASCRPLALTVPPFLVGRPREGNGPGQVHIDLDHPRVATNGDGVRVFDDDGRPTAFLEEIAGMLGLLDEGFQSSGLFHAAMNRYGLLEPFSMDVPLADGSTHRLVGYHLINEERLRTLEPGALADLQAGGHLLPACMAVASLGNLAKLVRRKNRRLHV